MEDAHVAMGTLPVSSTTRHRCQSTRVALFGVFDGHGGQQVADFCAEHLPRAVAKRQPSETTLKGLVGGLHESFVYVDEKLARAGKKIEPVSGWHPDNVGCTAAACLVSSAEIVVANAGDSRVVLSHRGQALELSRDHKPNMPSEHARITKAGGFVTEHRAGNKSIHRVNGKLAVSRAFGDHRFKTNSNLGPVHQMVTCVPEVTSRSRRPEDEFLIIACDGIWDVMSSQEVVHLVQTNLPAIRSGF